MRYYIMSRLLTVIDNFQQWAAYIIIFDALSMMLAYTFFCIAKSPFFISMIETTLGSSFYCFTCCLWSIFCFSNFTVFIYYGWEVTELWFNVYFNVHYFRTQVKIIKYLQRNTVDRKIIWALAIVLASFLRFDCLFLSSHECYKRYKA